MHGFGHGTELLPVPGGDLIEGIVTGLRTDAEGNVLLELDGGDQLRLRDVTGSAPNE